MATISGRPGRRGTGGGSAWRGLLALVMLVGAWAPRPAVKAQAGVLLDSVTIELWPEYDQPSMLVILQISLAATTALPATLTLHIPAASKGPSAVAVQDTGGQLLTAPFTTALAGDTLAVQLDTSSRSVQLEYYDPALKISGDTRDYDFQWKADYAVSGLSFRVQEPVDARNLSGQPPLSPAGASGQGLTDDTSAPQAVAAGQMVSLHLSYTKSTSTLSKAAVDQITAAPTAVQPAAVNPPAAGSQLAQELLLGGAALVVLGLVAWAGLRFNRTRGADRARSPAASAIASAPPAKPLTGSNGNRFCTACGRPAVAEDRFCRRCGAPLRSGLSQADPQ